MCSDMDFKIFKNDKHTMAEAMRSLTLHEIPFRQFRALYARVPSSINNRQDGIMSTGCFDPRLSTKVGGQANGPKNMLLNDFFSAAEAKR